LPQGPRSETPSARALAGSANDHEVEFIIVVGYAVAAHGFVRATKDIDICPEPSDGNLRRLAAAIAELEATPIGLEEFEGEFDSNPDLDGLRMGDSWTLMTKHGRLDVMQTFNFEGPGEEEAATLICSPTPSNGPSSATRPDSAATTTF
jgi:hypothetical protein